MRLIFLIMVLSCLAACEKYTEQTSPCVDKTRIPASAGSDGSSLAFASKPPGSKAPVSNATVSKNCIFEALGPIL